ncbi:MAG: hypothetical protein ACI36V_00235 [Coriobacteriales bacterium]
MDAIELLGFYRELSKGHDVEEVAARLLAEPGFADGNAFPTLRRLDKRGRHLPYRELRSSRDASRLAELEAQTDRPRRREEYIAMQFYARGRVEGLGVVLDYQTPIGGNAGRLSDDPALAAALERAGFQPGKIDLVAYDEDGARLVLYELKVPDSPESLLRCAVEAHTYLHTIDADALVADMRAVCAERGIEMAGEVVVCAAPLVFWGSLQHRQWLDGRRYPKLHELMRAMGMEPVFISGKPGQGIYVEGLRAWPRVESELCSALRERYRQICPDAVYADESAIEGLPPNPYYLEEVSQNLVCGMAEEHERQYGAGLGGELEGKMRALRSSSAMTFNLLGNRGCEVLKGNPLGLGPGAYTVAYEAQLATLKPSVSRRKANLDALLMREGGGTAIACEMKMMEWLQVPSRDAESGRALKATYLSAGSYDCADAADALVLERTAAELCRAFEGSRYDAAQMFRHAVALLNALEHGGLGDVARLILLNCIWEPSDPDRFSCADVLRQMIAEEHAGFELFCEVMEPVAALFARRGVALEIMRCTPLELAACLDKTAGELAYLQRYA